jgi:hypothetical protein
MLYKTCRSLFSFLLALLMLASVLPTRILAVDEGMFLPDAISTLPIQELRRRGLQLEPTDLYNPNAPSLTDAMVQVGGGSGSFVSNEGLLLTNHHVVFDALVAASTPQNNYGETGYTARTRTEELPAQGYRASITQNISDVTQQVLAGIPDTLSPTDRSNRINARIAEMTQAANREGAEAGLTARITPLNEGLRYYKFTQLVLRDVRIVYAPPKSIGYYGGDPDNFEWPRHAGDFAFMRAYVGPDGRPAAHSANNVPYRPRRFLQISMDGVREGDFTFVMGHPGSTRRYRESYSIAYNQENTIPQQVEALRQRLEALEEIGRRDPAARVRLQSEVFGISNVLKAQEGAILALRRSDLAAQRRRQEEEFTRWVNADPGRRARYGEALPTLARAYESLRQGGARDRILENLSNSDTLLTLAIIAAQAAAERDKPEAERNQALLATAQQIRAGISQILPQLNAESGAAELTRVLSQGAELPANNRIQILENRFGTLQGDARRRAETEFARSLVTDPMLSQPNAAETVGSWFTMTTAQLRALNKPYFNFAFELLPESAAASRRTQEFNAIVQRYRPIFVAGMNEMRGGRLYPDANGTLRFTYGEVRGYVPRDAITYAPFTYLSGVFEKDTGREPFNAPERLRELFRARNFGQYAAPDRPNDVPLNFLSTTDIIGGNSGSPIMNGRGEMIGLVFDGNYEGLGNDFYYDESLQRSISVDIRYVLFLTDRFANAGYILRELTIAPRGAQRRAA